jgi:hypothetical protein
MGYPDLGRGDDLGGAESIAQLEILEDVRRKGLDVQRPKSAFAQLLVLLLEPAQRAAGVCCAEERLGVELREDEDEQLGRERHQVDSFLWSTRECERLQVRDRQHGEVWRTTQREVARVVVINAVDRRGCLRPSP